MASGLLNDEALKNYKHDGYVIAKHMFNREEIDLLGSAAWGNREMDQHWFGEGDGEAGLRRFGDSGTNVAWLNDAEDKSASTLKQSKAARAHH